MIRQPDHESPDVRGDGKRNNRALHPADAIDPDVDKRSRNFPAVFRRNAAQTGVHLLAHLVLIVALPAFGGGATKRRRGALARLQMSNERIRAC
jgi:hypothetical protein